MCKYKQEKRKQNKTPFAFTGLVNKMKNKDFWDYWEFFAASLATLWFCYLQNIQISALISLR